MAAEPAAAGLPRALVLTDGEHYPPVVRAAIAALAGRFDVRAALLLGGAEKLRGEPHASEYGVRRIAAAAGSADQALARLIEDERAEAVIDLSDEPVVSARSRLRLASIALARGAVYEAAGMRLEPPARLPYPEPSLAISGTGKRVGKTALSGHTARLAASRLAAAGEVVIVAMGRGGPAAPELVDPRAAGLDAGSLLERARAGAHAASDFLEDAVLAGVTTVGCRRCGGGPAGAVWYSNVAAGAALAAARRPALTLFEGSGAAAAPIAADRSILVTSARAPLEELLGYLGPCRILAADLIIVVGAEPDAAAELAALQRGVRELAPETPIVPAVLRPRPAAPVAGRRVAVFTTARANHQGVIARTLAERHGCEVVGVYGSLSDRPLLRADLDLAERAGADLYLTEIKAAAVDVVLEAAVQRGVEATFLDNAPESPDGSEALDRALVGLIDAAAARRARR